MSISNFGGARRRDAVLLRASERIEVRAFAIRVTEIEKASLQDGDVPRPQMVDGLAASGALARIRTRRSGWYGARFRGVRIRKAGIHHVGGDFAPSNVGPVKDGGSELKVRSDRARPQFREHRPNRTHAFLELGDGHDERRTESENAWPCGYDENPRLLHSRQ
jgi:hypothetical protein